MFAKYPFIEEQHKLALTSIIRQQPYVTEPFLATLYRAALDAGTGDCPQSISANSLEKGVLRSATDRKTGVFIQLAKTDKGTMLTVGKKWSIQGFDPVSNTTQTIMLQ